MKRFITLLLLAAMLVSCGSGSTESKDTSSADNTDSTTEPEVTTESEEAKLPDIDLGGKTVTILVSGNQIDYFDIEEQDGDIVDDAIWQARENVADRLNCKIKYMRDPANGDWNNCQETINYVTSSVMADSGDFDAVDNQSYMGNYLVNGLLVDMGKMKYIDIDNPWWDKSITENVSLNGKYPFLAGSYSLGRTASIFCIYYNKNIAADFDLPDLYQLVYDGGWTIDKLQEYSEMVYSDLNGNGEVDKDDRFGMLFEGGNYVSGFYVPCGVKALNVENGKFVLDYDNSHNVEVVERLEELMKTKGVYHDYDVYSAGYDYKKSIFAEGNSLFNGGLFETASNYRNVSFDYGILPYPKYSETDKDYVQSAHITVGLLGIPKSNYDTDSTSAVLECLSYEYYKNVIPAYYETTMKVKYSSDNETANMLDFISSRLSYDAGIVLTGALDYKIDVTFKECILQLDNWTTRLAKINNSIKSLVEKLNEEYDQLG